MMQRATRLIVLALLVAAIALPFAAPTYYMQFATKVLILGMLAMALNLVVGFGGLVSVCHAAFYGIAGYVLAIAAPKYEPASLWLTLPLALIASSAAALILGALSLRTRGVYFIMVTLAFGEMLFYFFHDTKFAGGSDGAFINLKPEAMLFGVNVLNLDKARVFYWAVLAMAVLTILLLHTITRAPFGRARQRAPRPLARLSDLSRASHCVCHLRRAGRACGLFRRRAVRLRCAGNARLAPIGDRAGDGRARRPAQRRGAALWRDHRDGTGRVAERTDRALEADRGPDHHRDRAGVPERPSGIGCARSAGA
jgi:Branched-chain amino acid transport system / permease component